MSDTLDQIAYNILNKIEGGRSHNNTYYSLDQIKYNIENYRALFLRRDLRDSHDLKNFEQSLVKPVFRVISSVVPDPGRMSMIAISHVLTTKEPLPSVLRTKHQLPLTVHDIKKREFYPVVEYIDRYWQMFNKYTSKYPRCHVKDGYLFIEGDVVSRALKQAIEKGQDIDENVFLTDIKEIEIRGVFESPTEVMVINGVDPTETGSQPYPLTKDLIQRITEGLINGELQMLMQSPNDTKHNTLPDHKLQ